MKTSELTGAALDWAVAMAEGFGTDQYMRRIDIRLDVRGKCSCLLIPINREYVQWHPSTDWVQGGPIIEREKIAAVYRAGEYWLAYTHENYQGRQADAYGPTPLIAAMRCYVASKLGNEVDVPKELTP